MHERQHLRLLLAFVFAATLVGGTVSLTAARVPPGWSSAAVATPGTVTNGEPAGFVVTFTNAAPNNASQLYLVAATPPGAAFVKAFPSQGTCNATGPLMCTLGAVNAGASATVTVVYNTPTSGSVMNVIFEFNTTGVAADVNKRSHGDSVRTNPEQTPVNLSSTNNRDFRGRFAWNNSLLNIQDDQNLGNKNKQATSVNGPALSAPLSLTVGEQPLGAFACPPAEGRNRPCFSEWSVLNVGDGAPFDQGFTASAALGHWEIPSQIDASNVGFVHVKDDGTGAFVINRCPNNAPPATTDDYPCFTAVDSGMDIIATFYFLENGRVGGY
jgi:hypothetical protein